LISQTNTKPDTIKCYPDTLIYILCPANHATGGPEALHQLAHHLIKLGYRAFMYYLPDDVAEPVHPFYERYNVPFVRSLDNSSRNILILPESYLIPLYQKNFSKIRKVIWWLSVVNYHLGLQNWQQLKRRRKLWLPLTYFQSKYIPAPAFNQLKQLPLQHIRHSYFAEVHLRDNGIIPIGRVSDYMNASFFDMIDDSVVKQDLVIYNPIKNDGFLQSIIAQTPQFNWKPLIDMSPAEVASWMNRAKVYVDFGTHPGKERMPREACILNCCLVIGKIGSAQYHQDMPIDEQYRFDKVTTLIPDIINTISNCLSNYDKHIQNFKKYRNELLNEEESFITDIQSVFKQIK
jgi:hypothetical protein